MANSWMAWLNGLNAVLFTKEGLPQPNIIFHIADAMSTPVGTTRGGMLFYRPEGDEKPRIAAFVAEDERVGRFLGPNLFQGTPFENAPVVKARMRLGFMYPKSAMAIVEAGGDRFELELADFGEAAFAERAPSAEVPYTRSGMEAAAKRAVFKFNGVAVPVVVPPAGPGGSPPVCFAPGGVYRRT